MHGQILLRDVLEWIVTDRVPGIGANSPFQPMIPIQLAGRIPVIDHQAIPASQTLTDLPYPVVKRRNPGDLRSNRPGGNVNSLPRQPTHRIGGLHRWRQRTRLPLEPAGCRVPYHPAFLQRITGPDHLVRRQRVRHLVGQRHAGDRLDPIVTRRFLNRDDIVQADLDHRAHCLGQPMAIHIAQSIAQHLAQLRRIHADAGDDVVGHAAHARTVLPHHERVGAVQPLPHLGDLPGDGDAEKWMQLGRGDEVATPAGTPGGRLIVANLGMIERNLHEAGEGDRFLSPDLVTQDRDRVGVATFSEGGGWE